MVSSNSTRVISKMSSMVGIRKDLKKYFIQKCVLLFPLFLVLALSSCSLFPPNEAYEEDEGENHVSHRWMGMMLNLHIIEKLIEYDEGGSYVQLLRGEAIENDYDRGEQEENYLVLTSVEALIEEEEGISVNFDDTEWKIDGESEYKFTDAWSPLWESARLGKVDWCEKGESHLYGEDFSVHFFYMEWYDDFREYYSTEEEYLESIEDYVNCGSGHI